MGIGLVHHFSATQWGATSVSLW